MQGGTTAENQGVANAQPKWKFTAAALAESGLAEGEAVDIEDEVYRIFNLVRFEKDGKRRASRDLILGSPGNVVRAILWDKNAELVDTWFVQRRDKVLATNLKLKKEEGETLLYGTVTTSISRITPARSAVTDFASLMGGEKNIDVSGRVISIGATRLFKGLGGKENGVAECTISDGRISMRVALWGACSSFTASMHPGDYLKLEFVAARATEAGLEISANDYSRLLLSKAPL